MEKAWNLLVCLTLLHLSVAQDMWPVSEFRAVWIATVGNIDWPESRHLSTDQQKQSLVTILNKLQELHFNAVIFQVRTSGDAVYQSHIEPWSVYLTGTQGQAPNPLYDPLQFLITEAHNRNIEVHAWFNPYRARAGSTRKSDLDSLHMCFRFTDSCFAYGNDLWMDPGNTTVLNYTLNVFDDVVRRYDVDGIHIDDYFYPYPVHGQAFQDAKSYKSYQQHGGTLALHDWRRNNINTLIETLSKNIKKLKPYVKFGISPFGIWKPGYPHGIKGFNAYESLYADSRKWLEDGTVDYMTPQLYWAIDPPDQSYTALLDWWCQQNPRQRHIYAGNYVAGLVAKHWAVMEMERQVAESRARRQYLSLGNVFFSAKYFVNNIHNVSSHFLSDHVYDSPALTPEMPWLNRTWTGQHNLLQVKKVGVLLSWSVEHPENVRSFALYKEFADGYKLVRTLQSNVRSLNLADPLLESGVYALRSVDRLGHQGTEHIFDIDKSINVNVIG